MGIVGGRFRKLGLGVASAALGAALMAGPAKAEPVITEATGANAAAIQAEFDAFASQFDQRISWDGGRPDPPAFSGSHLIADPFFMPEGQFRGPRGVVVRSPARGFKMSSDPDPALAGTPADVPPNYGGINPTYTSTFAPFSAPRLFTPIDSNTYDVEFVLNGTDDPAGTSGFGVVFSDVNVDGQTSIEYFAPNGRSFGSFDVPATNGDQTFSFLGVGFDEGEQIGSVRITNGTAAIAEGVNDIDQGGTNDLVVNDDFLLAETVPADLRPPRAPKIRRRAAPDRKEQSRRARFRFRTRQETECRLTKKGKTNRREKRRDQWRPCDSPQRYKRLRPGKYVFKVRAIDPSLNTSKPARWSWKVQKRR